MEDEPRVGAKKGECVRFTRHYTVVVQQTTDCQPGYLERAFKLEGAFCFTEDGKVTEQKKPTFTPGRKSKKRGGSKVP
jgi:hypothetical protein